MARDGFTTSAYYSIADAAGMTLPNGDWSWIYTIRTGSDITTLQDITLNGVYRDGTSLNIYVVQDSESPFADRIWADVAALNPTEDHALTITANTWYVVSLIRSSGTVNLKIVPFGSTSVSTSTGVSISAAYDSSTGYVFGIANDLVAPFLGGIGDAIFVPGVALSNTDLGNIATGTAMNSTGWWSSREFHLIASDESDHTGNHTVTTNGSPTSLAG